MTTAIEQGLRLTELEREELLRLLDERLTELEIEINRTDAPTFRAALYQRENALKSVREKLLRASQEP